MTIQVSMVPDVAETKVQVKVDRQAYLQSLLHQRSVFPHLDGASSQVWLQVIRDRATEQVKEQSIPSTREEEWRFTDLTDLLQTEFVSAPPNSVKLADLAAWTLPEANHSRLVFVDGVFAPTLSAIAGLPAGAIVSNLPPTLDQPLQNYLAKLPGADAVFTALNTACFTDAAIVVLPRNTAIEAPIHLLFVSTTGEKAPASHPRCLVVAESDSRLTLVEEFFTLGEGSHFTNAVTEVWLAENAQVNHVRVQRNSLAAFHIGKTAVSQARNSRYTCTAVSLGATLSRHNLEVFQAGEQTETTLNGLTMIGATQVADTHSTIAFARPYGTSNQTHKCIVSDRAHAIFNGKIFVPKAAQLTNAAQVSRNLLLSPKARVDTKPQLEITADNVKCAHGATVSQLEDDEVFYLQSRGINQDSARKLLVYAFAAEVIGQITIPSLRENLSAIARIYPA